MSTHARWTRCCVATLAGMVVVAIASPGNAAPRPEHAPKKDLGFSDEQLLAKARAHGDKTVTLLIAADPGRGSAVVAGVAKLGGHVEHHADSLGYLRVKVPTSKAEEIAALAGVTAVDVDQVIPIDDPRPEGAANPIAVAPPSKKTPRRNPYLPTRDTGAAQFVNGHPTWDGRGVTVGILDTGIDLHNPALQTTSTGARKIVDWVTYTDPTFVGDTNADNDPTWLRMDTNVSGPTFTAGGTTYTAPGAGSYRFGIFNERDPRLGGELGNDVNRDGNPAGSSGLFGVLWDPTTNNVWVDSNQNASFSDQAAMTDYKTNYDVGYFGIDDPATPIREAIPFVVQTDPADNEINIGIVSGAHGSHVAGIVAGNDVFGGPADGAAPGAQLVSVRVCLFADNCTAHALIEGMIYAASVAKVDVINLSIGGPSALNDGNNARAELYNRLIDEYGMQIYTSAGNDGAGVNTVGDPGTDSKLVTTGSYVSSSSLLSNYGSLTAPVDNLSGFSARGPREDGGFKPELVAPGSAVSTVPDWQGGQPVAGTYALPPGLGMFNGTSMSSPEVAGVGALLVSAAKATGRSHTPDQIRKALFSSARFLPGYGAYEQGNGLVRASGAWNILDRDSLRTDAISSAVPVHTLLSGFLATPGMGPGIYDREGVQVGDKYTRTYTLRRTTGDSGPVTYKLSWVGNDGTFKTATSVQLPRDTDVSLPVTVRASSVGAHSAILRFNDPAATGIEYETLNTVIAPYDLETAVDNTQTVSGDLAPDQTTSYFVRVPSGGAALAVKLAGPSDAPGTGQLRFLRFHPYGVAIDSNAVSSCYTPSAGSCAGDPLERTVTNAQPGVWEIVVEARRTSDAPAAHYTLTTSLLSASVAPDPDLIASAPLNTPVERSYTVSNRFGAFTGRAVGTALASARISRPTIADAQQMQFQVTVPPGTTSLRARIGNAADSAADLDLYLYNCTTGTCVLGAVSATSGAEESVTITNPAAGSWVALVDGYAVPSGTTSFDYEDAFASPAYGAISVTDADALRPAGAPWTVTGTVIATALPGAGRVLLGNVNVVTSQGDVIGQNRVILQSVS